VALHPSHSPIDAGLQLAAPAVVQVEGVQLGQQAHGGSLPQAAHVREKPGPPLGVSMDDLVGED